MSLCDWLVLEMSRIKVYYILIGLAALFYRECSGQGLTVVPTPSQLVVQEGEEVDLLCTASQRPSICLWRTPYGSIYTVGGGRSWEAGRLAASPLAGNTQCGLSIRGVAERDQGTWQCEVGSVIGGEFTTTTAETNIKILHAKGVEGSVELVGVEGKDVRLECSGLAAGGRCSWRTPYDRTYHLQQGEYAERGRIQAVGECSIRVGNLQGRDGGNWTCLRDEGRVLQHTIQLAIEAPLKLSAPTSILQQADEKATLVCHANKEFETCTWETPYKSTVSFTDKEQHEEGRLQYFGFSNMDCGIVIKGVNPRDSGGWTCRVTATVAGQTQVSADIVRLFVEPPPFEQVPRSLSSRPLEYSFDYSSEEGRPNDYDAFDYVNGDFDKVLGASKAATAATSAASSTSSATSTAGTASTFTTSLLPVTTVKNSVPTGSTAVATVAKPVPDIHVERTIEESDGFIRDIQKIGKFGTVRIDRVESSHVPLPASLPEHSPTEQAVVDTTVAQATTTRGQTSVSPEAGQTTPGKVEAHSPTGVTSLPGIPVDVSDEELRVGLDPSELDFLARISGARVDNRPFRLENETQFGTRQSSAGSRFQFGAVHLQIENETKNRESSNTRPSSVTLRTASSAAMAATTAATSTASALTSTATAATVDAGQRTSVGRIMPRPPGSEATSSTASAVGRIMTRLPGIEATTTSTASAIDVSTAASISSTIEDISERRVAQMRREQEMMLRRREEAARKVESSRVAETTSKTTEQTSTKTAEQSRNILRQRVRGKGPDDPPPDTTEDTQRPPAAQEAEEEERRLKIEQLKEKQVEESRRLQEERDRKRAQQADQDKRRSEEEEKEAKRIKEEKQRTEEAAIKKLLEEKAIEEENKLKKIQEEQSKKLEAERERIRQELEDKRAKQLQEERERRLQEEADRIRKELEDKRRKEAEEIEKLRKEQEEKARIEKEEEERRKRVEEEEARRIIEEKKLKEIQAEREKQLKEEAEKRRQEDERTKKEQEEQRRRKQEEDRKKELEEQRKRKEEEEQRKIKDEEDRKKELEEQRKKKEEEDRKKELEEQRRQKEEEDRKRELEEQRKRKEEEERQKDLEYQRIKKEEDEKLKALEDQRKRKEEEERQKEIERARLKELEEERQRRRKEEREKILLEFQEKKKEEEKKRQEEEERRQKLLEEQERLRKEAEEKKRKEEDEAAAKKREEEREEEERRQKKIQEEREQELREEAERTRRREEEEREIARLKEEEIQQHIRKMKEEQEERERFLKAEAERIQKETEIQRRKEAEEAAAAAKVKAKDREDEEQHRQQELDRVKEQQLERELKLKAEREKLEKEKEKLAKQQEELKRQRELLERIRGQQDSSTPKPLLKPNTEEERICLISPWPTDGNITCSESVLARGNYIVKSGKRCHLDCNRGFVSLDARETTCVGGVWTAELMCVKPGAMLLVGGRSDTYGVLSSAELVTSGGVCRGAVPPLPAMRWKAIAAALDSETVVVCGGINFLGDPRTDCWRLQAQGAQPEWVGMSSLAVPRDASAWAAEGGKLFVMGGSLGSLSGYTASVEVYEAATDSWSVGPSLTSTRASHCAVGLGNGSIIVTGGYGALGTVQRLDIATDRWTDLPELTPLRAQHGCGLVELGGRKGVIVVGGDSGGTRLSDVRFLAIDRGAEWIKVPDLNTARWGRPSVGTIGGKITVLGGWDGVKALSTVEYYEEKTGSWVTSKTTRLTTERRWAAGTQVENKLFPRCAQKRQ